MRTINLPSLVQSKHMAKGNNYFHHFNGYNVPLAGGGGDGRCNSATAMANRSRVQSVSPRAAPFRRGVNQCLFRGLRNRLD